jgi:hypothetical protein
VHSYHDPTGYAGGFVPGAGTQAKGTFLYGAGGNYTLTKLLSLRAEYFAYPSFEQEAPAIVFYVGEFYVRALPHVRGTPRESATIQQLQFFMNWLASNQKSRNAGSPVDCWHMTYMAGMLYIMYATQNYYPHNEQAADQEQVLVHSLLDSNGNLSNIEVWELTVWALWSASGDEAAEVFNTPQNLSCRKVVFDHVRVKEQLSPGSIPPSICCRHHPTFICSNSTSFAV